MKKLILNFAAVCFTAVIFSFVSAGEKNLTGIWNFNVENVPAGYDKGEMTINEKDGKLSGNMSTENGTFDMEDVKVNNDTVTYNLTVQNATLQARLIATRDTLSGMISGPDGDMKITAVRKVIKQ